MKIHFSPAEQKIVDILRDREWHCLYTELKMKDDRRRLTDIRGKLGERGYDIESRPCTIHNHSSRLFMRRILKTPSKSPKRASRNEGMTQADMILASQDNLRRFEELV